MKLFIPFLLLFFALPHAAQSTDLYPSLKKPILYMPWRSGYAQKKINPTDINNACPFCRMTEEKTKNTDNFVLVRFEHCMVALNLYPYSKGHLLVIPYAHIKILSELTDEARNEIAWLTSMSSDIIKEAIKADGINVGINLGTAAGASVPDHLHIQIVPRFNKETITSFIHVVGGATTIPWNLNQLYRELLPAFEKLHQLPNPNF